MLLCDKMVIFVMHSQVSVISLEANTHNYCGNNKYKFMTVEPAILVGFPTLNMCNPHIIDPLLWVGGLVTSHDMRANSGTVLE